MAFESRKRVGCFGRTDRQAVERFGRLGVGRSPTAMTAIGLQRVHVLGPVPSRPVPSRPVNTNFRPTLQYESFVSQIGLLRPSDVRKQL